MVETVFCGLFYLMFPIAVARDPGVTPALSI